MKQYISKLMFVVLLCLAASSSVQAQYGFGTTNPNPSAVMDMTSTTKGFLPPRMTSAQIAAIKSPAEGLMVYNTDQQCMMVYAKGAFTCGFAASTPPPVAGSPVVDGKVRLSREVSASYVYSSDNVAQGATRFQWYYANDVNGSGQTALNGADAKSYTVTSPVKENQYVAVAITPLTVNGTAGLQVMTSWALVVPNTAPSVASLTISASGNTFGTVAGVTGSYSDADDDVIATPVYQWYRCSDASGGGKTAIAGANGSNYTFTKLDIGSYIGVGVKATTTSGISPSGERMASSYLPVVWSCGATFKVQHKVGDGVSPATVEREYQTVLMSTDGKCWIHQNLGAVHPANSVDDVTDESAGWYWQFNRKQGFEVSPKINPSWPSGGSKKNVDWKAENDPCRLLLKGNWRLPTLNELKKVLPMEKSVKDNFSPGLKLHYASLIFKGSLAKRPDYLVYWSSDSGGQSLPAGWSVGATKYGDFREGSSTTDKAFPVRCMLAN